MSGSESTLLRGRDGKDGRDGNYGINGRDGNDGRDGKDGERGRDGRDGEKGQKGEGEPKFIEIKFYTHPLTSLLAPMTGVLLLEIT